MFDVANRTLWRGGIGLGKHLHEEPYAGNANDLSSDCTRSVPVAAMSIALLLGTRSTLMLFNLNEACDKPCMLGQAEDRLRKKHEDCAKAQC